MNKELFEELLSQSENDALDFKTEFYDFSGDSEKSKEVKETKFIKDIISFANTKRKKSSYIIIGIKEYGASKEKELLGVTSHPDDASLQEKVKDKVYPIPEFSYYSFTYMNKKFGIIEIPIPKYSEVPYYPRKDYLGGLLKSELYFRRGSSNSVATPEEEKHIRDWFYGLKNLLTFSDNNTNKSIDLTNVPNIVLEDVIGRDKELQEIFEYFKTNEKPLIVTAIGGIGKSTLARAYVKKFRSQYQKIIWIDVTDSIQSSIVSNQILLHNLQIELPKSDFDLADKSKDIYKEKSVTILFNKKIESNYDIILNTLRKIEGKNLLILDNAESNLSYEKILLPNYPNWHVLATSREKIDGFFEYPLMYLSRENAIELFKKYAGNKGTNSDIEKLGELVNFHTLAIELFAKELKVSLEIDTVNELYELLTVHRLNDKSLVYDIETDHSKQEIELYSYLFKVFDLSKLDADNFSIPVLKQICLFPPDFLPSSIFIELLESETISKKDITHSLKYLSKKGWLEENNKVFKIHKIIKEVLWYKLHPAFEDCENLIKKLTEKFGTSDEHLEKAETLEYYADIVSSISESLHHLEIIDMLLSKASQVYFQLKRYSDIISVQTRAIKIIKNPYYPYYLIGSAYAAQKDNNNAIHFLSKSISLIENLEIYFPHSFFNRAIVYESMQNFDKAIEDYTQALNKYPAFTDAYYKRGCIYKLKQKNNESLIDFTRCIILDPTYMEAYEKRASIYEEQKKYEEAINDYSEIIKLEPESINAYYRRGLAYYNSGHYTLGEPINDFSKVISLNGKFADGYYYRGLAYIQAAEFEDYQHRETFLEAIEDFTKAISLDENDAYFYYNRGIAFSSINKLEEAIQDLSKALLIQKNFSDAYFERGNLYDRIQEYYKAIQDFSEVIFLNSNHEQAYYSRGLTYTKLKNFENAILDFTQAIKFNSSHYYKTNYHYTRGLAYKNFTEYEKALSDFDTATSNVWFGLNPRYFGSISQVLFIIGKQKEAIEAFNKAISLTKEDVLHGDFSDVVELWFYAYAHIAERRLEAEENLTKLIQNGVKSVEWNFLPNIEKAIEDGHPDILKLKDFAEQITDIQFK